MQEETAATTSLLHATLRQCWGRPSWKLTDPRLNLGVAPTGWITQKMFYNSFGSSLLSYIWILTCRVVMRIK